MDHSHLAIHGVLEGGGLDREKRLDALGVQLRDRVRVDGKLLQRPADLALIYIYIYIYI